MHVNDRQPPRHLPDGGGWQQQRERQCSPNEQAAAKAHPRSSRMILTSRVGAKSMAVCFMSLPAPRGKRQDGESWPDSP